MSSSVGVRMANVPWMTIIIIIIIIIITSHALH